MSKITFTYEEVKKLLCEACKLGIKEHRDVDQRQWVHSLNDIEFPCEANNWRNLVDKLEKGEPNQ